MKAPRFTDGGGTCRVQISRCYVPPPMRMSDENMLLQATLLKPGQRWSEPSRLRQVAWGAGLVCGFLALFGLVGMLC